VLDVDRDTGRIDVVDLGRQEITEVR
jgi:hypothetical protein